MLEPARLPSRVAQEIERSSNVLWLSPISAWEALLLIDGGRLDVGPDPAAWLNQAWAALPARDAVMTREIATASRRLKLPHQDPADRFIGATALVGGLTLITADQHLLDSKQIPTLSAR